MPLLRPGAASPHGPRSIARLALDLALFASVIAALPFLAVARALVGKRPPAR